MATFIDNYDYAYWQVFEALEKLLREKRGRLKQLAKSCNSDFAITCDTCRLPSLTLPD